MGGDKLAVGSLADLNQLLAQTAFPSLMPFGSHWSLDPLPFRKGKNRLLRHSIPFPQFPKGKSGLFQVLYQIVFLALKYPQSPHLELTIPRLNLFLLSGGINLACASCFSPSSY